MEGCYLNQIIQRNHYSIRFEREWSGQNGDRTSTLEEYKGFLQKDYHQQIFHEALDGWLWYPASWLIWVPSEWKFAGTVNTSAIIGKVFVTWNSNTAKRQFHSELPLSIWFSHDFALPVCSWFPPAEAALFHHIFLLCFNVLCHPSRADSFYRARFDHYPKDGFNGSGADIRENLANLCFGKRG